MFEQAFLTNAARTRRPWTVPLGFACELAVVAAAALLPLALPERLPATWRLPFIIHAPVRRATQPPSVRVIATSIERRTHPGAFVAPSFIPRGVPRVLDPEPLATGPAAAPGVGDADGARGVPWGIEGGMPLPAAQLPPPPPVRAREPAKPAPPPKPPARIVLGGNVQEAKLIHKVLPVYPPLARQARVSGQVRLAAVIGTDGRIRELRVLSGHPMLVRAAAEAVMQWLYRPTLLNGEPVEVSTEVKVDFILQ